MQQIWQYVLHQRGLEGVVLDTALDNCDMLFVVGPSKSALKAMLVNELL